MFDLIAPVYGLFYDFQKKRYADIVEGARGELDIVAYRRVLDVGCGTGALCAVLKDKGMEVTGIDPAVKMLDIAKGRTPDKSIAFLQGNVLDGLPFEDKTFDIAMASYVAHGLKAGERKRMYAEMSRVTRGHVIIHDYNDKRSFVTSVIEWLEGGDYFHFIKNAEPEMKHCVTEMKSCFSEVRVIEVDTRANWYLCTPLE